MKRIAAIWTLSVGVLIGGLLLPQRAAANSDMCALSLSWDETWQCDFEAERISKVSCGRCVWVAPDASEWADGCVYDAPDGCTMVDSIEECGFPSQHCDSFVEYVDEECEDKVFCPI